MNQIEAILKRLLPSGKGFIAGTVTAGIVFVANRVFHVHLVNADVELAITPFVALLVASMAHEGTKVEQRVTPEVVKVEKVVEASPLGPVANLVAKAIDRRLLADPSKVEDEFIKATLALLTDVSPEAPRVVEDVIKDIEAAEPKVIMSAHGKPLFPLTTPQVPTPTFEQKVVPVEQGERVYLGGVVAPEREFVTPVVTGASTAPTPHPPIPLLPPTVTVVEAPPVPPVVEVRDPLTGDVGPQPAE